MLIEAEASGFLPHQIRRTNGILVEIGLGRSSVEVIKAMIDGTLRELKNCPSLPAKGAMLDASELSESFICGLPALRG